MSSNHPPISIPELHISEDSSPSRIPTPTPAETQRARRKALFEVQVDCPHRDEPGKKRRNLIVNIDGTLNQFRNNKTNIFELYSRIIQVGGDVKQLVFYDNGIGTFARPLFRSFDYWKQVIYDYIGSFIGRDIELIIHAAYGWLSENYEPGDRIFLFGFSRGAYQVRVIAGMIEIVGLLQKGNEKQIPFAYELYTVLTAKTRTSILTKVSNSTSQNKQFQPQPSESEEEKLRVWDTVPSIGVLYSQPFPEMVSGMAHVCHFRHALALDECGVKFQPEYANGGLGPIKGSPGDVKEVWFKGTHSDIGGGNEENEDPNNFSDSLRWMIFEAQSCRLLFKPYNGNWVTVDPKESLTWAWMLLEFTPFGVLAYMKKHSLTWWPHRGQPRKIQPGQLIHQSVFTPSALDTNAERELDALSKVIPFSPPPSRSYTPKALLVPSLEVSNWEDLFAVFSFAPRLPIIEQDPFENASHTLNSLSHACDILESGTGDKSHTLNIIAAAIQTLQSFLGNSTRLSSLLEVPNVDKTLLKVMSAALVANARPGQHPFPISTHLRPKFADVYKWGSSFLATTYRDDFFRALQPFALMGNLQIHVSILNVAFSTLDPRRPVFTASSHAKTLVLIWDGSTQPPRETANAPGPYPTISRNGSHIAVVGVKDVSILPSVIKCTDTENPNESGNISSLCISDDHQTLATGHWKGWAKLWRREGDQWKVSKSLEARGNPIESLAFSRDASHLPFTMDLGPTKVWSFDDRDPALIELKDSHENSISLVWSFSGEWIVAGTVHGRVKIWNSNLERSRTLLRAMTVRFGVSPSATMIKYLRQEIDTDEWVASIAFSPGGKQLLSGGCKGRLCLWDVDMGDDET
ncbi:hypothetical protein ONZ45_g14527 [Pleurotus djamor]|nr:hypothetical protein ONZ45_g14527 [Pleurotus djamor]